ncbi:unnamed protein product [Auanema sp. JU1783]|nr:unnamed protein product [Auanema sp. JU1783]
MNWLLVSIFATQIYSIYGAFSFETCNVTESCWFHPPTCQPNSKQSCLSAVRWRMQPDGIQITLEGDTTDISQTGATFLAAGFSYNQRMDDDMVFECVLSSTGMILVQLSFNDETKNEVLYQPTSVLLASVSSSVVDGILTCSGKILLDNINKVENQSLFKIHDIENRAHYLIFARGTANRYTLEKNIHSVNDDAQFPWITEDKISFCRKNCSTESTRLVQVTEMYQTRVTRYWRYRIAVLHGVALLVAWWILGSSAILIARYFKPLFPRSKLLGTAVWYQFHRDLFIISLVLQVVAVVFIFYQANWTWYECSYTCNADSWAKKMHAITGFAATALAVLQPFFAFLRPSPDSAKRPIFNWLHWCVGMTAWTLASVTFIFSLQLGKTGMNAVYGHVPNWIMGGYIAFFIGCNILLENISSTNDRRFEKSGPSGMALSTINGPSSELQTGEDTKQSLRLGVFFLHLAVALGVCIAITVMLVRHLLNHNP